jgi:hypothetical protein
MAETTANHVLDGYAFMMELARKSGLPLVFFAVEQDRLNQLTDREWLCPVLPIRRQLVPPWEKAHPLE